MKKWVVLGLALLFGAALVGAPSPAAADLKVAVSGYTKLDIQTGDRITGSFPSPGPADTPLDSNKEADNTQTMIDARQSRLRATFSDEVGGVKMSGRIETDFFTGDGNAKVSNSRHLRLRHAFARADHPSGFFILAGQYWALLMNIDIAQPDLVDFNGPAGQIFARQPQLKVGYKTSLGPGMGDLIFEVDVEKASFDKLSGTTNASDQGEGQDVPRFGGKISWLHPIVQAEVAGAVSRNRVIFKGGDTERDTDFGVQGAVQVNLAPVTLFAHGQHLDGVGGLGNADFGSQVVLIGGTELDTLESNGFYAGGRLDLTKDTSINVVYGYNKLDESDVRKAGLSGTTLVKHQSVHANILHKFWKHWQVGAEYGRFWVDALNDDDGAVNIGRFALWFFF